MDRFEFPANIKQIGTIDKGLRIYVEDYVATFIQQYAQAAGSNERLAFLIGKYVTIDSQAVLFISGAIEGRYCLEERGAMEFSDKSREHMLDTMDKYFSSLEVVGWVQSQPGYGTYLNSKYYNYHMENFKKDFQVLLVTDPIQKLSSFFVYNDSSELTESRGYFIYYDKNKAMHEYMIDNKSQNFAMPHKINDSKKDDDEIFNEKEEEPKAISRPVSLRAASTSSSPGSKNRTAVNIRGSGTATYDHRRIINMLTGLCAVMFLVSFIMGAGLLKSDDRISLLEQNLVALNTAYRNLAHSNEQIVSAFATGAPITANSALVVTEDGNKLLEAENAKAAEAAFAPVPPESVIPEPVALTLPQIAEIQTPSLASVPETYMVQQGDSLIGISQKFYGSREMVEKIMEANNITDPDKIFFGKILLMPKQ